MIQLKLKTALRKTKITQNELAEVLNIQVATLSRKMHGINKFTYDEVIKTCEFLCVSNPRDVFESEASK